MQKTGQDRNRMLGQPQLPASLLPFSFSEGLERGGPGWVLAPVACPLPRVGQGVNSHSPLERRVQEASLFGRKLVSWRSGVPGFTPTSADPAQPYLSCTCHLSHKAGMLCSTSLLCPSEGRAVQRAWGTAPEIHSGGSLCFHGSSLRGSVGSDSWTEFQALKAHLRHLYS